jgi:hypothetical protein
LFFRYLLDASIFVIACFSLATLRTFDTELFVMPTRRNEACYGLDVFNLCAFNVSLQNVKNIMKFNANYNKHPAAGAGSD